MTSDSQAAPARFHRLAEIRNPIAFTLDGVPQEAEAGDTLLCAVLTVRPALRRNLADGELRAGFCQIGACQDCLVRCNDVPVRACLTPLNPGDRIELVLDVPTQDGGGET
ncbi:(2Fe-2S)-binding protein [Alloyangia pacifica]|uniref:2Fe-2S iron-sulfur cluster binding domain-containing protein n=1 Tax=Alloyangia pacifica TaxID=311180 RepID=A0A1I6V0J8_9RHOB|nr:(2Fe-2S)-binding protein [Alloyangia pacifica]SDI33540.1 2Fe-2S iron-sulfur cluster binding domain-containing protein [Alloyangia pacifica]SFT07261.1 2Fe-2S iron-sulfur cluster binding domain-containing protein [Alloyangia pacifica]